MLQMIHWSETNCMSGISWMCLTVHIGIVFQTRHLPDCSTGTASSKSTAKKRRLEEELTEKTGADAAAAQPAERLLPQQFQPLSRVAADFMEQAWQAVVES